MKYVAFAMMVLVGVPGMVYAGLTWRRGREILLSLLIASTCFGSYGKMNFLSMETYRGPDRGFEVTLTDLIALAIVLVLVIQFQGKLKWIPPRTGLLALLYLGALSLLVVLVRRTCPDLRLRVLLSVARLDEQKNQLLAVEVLERVAAQVPEAWLLLAGPATNPEYAARLRERIAESPCRERIVLLGNVDAASQRVVDLYHAADVLLLTSTHEPFGIVLLEAWAAGLAVVASRVGGVPSFVRHRENGLLFASGDGAGAAEAVVEVLCSEATGRELRRQAALDVMRFDARVGLDAALEIYAEVQREHPVCA